MNNSQEVNQPNNNLSPSDPTPRRNPISFHNIFCFLKDKETTPDPRRPFFSQNGLSQDIIKVTDAEPDICLEVFHALYNTLWPQLERLNEYKKLGMEEHRSITSLQDAWKSFIGGSLSKGILWPPEKLMDDPQDVKASFAKDEGEKQVFLHLDTVKKSILNMKDKLVNYAGDIFQREEIMASLELIQDYYTEFRNKVKDLVTMILENKDPLTNYHALENLLEPKAVMMSDIFSHHWAFRIPRRRAKKLLSLNKWKDQTANYSKEGATHRVAALPEKDEALEPLVFFKANGRTAIQPEKEYMLYSLYQHLKIPVPETALLVLTDVFGEDPDYYYAVQASEAVIGESALETCRNQETIFEEKAYVEQVIGALLTNPSDGSFKNFQYSPNYKTLIGIDNDLVFKPEFTAEGGKTVNIKSVLYLLPLIDKPIPASIQTYFTTLDHHMIIVAWLHDLNKKNKDYELLFARLSYQQTRYKYQTLIPENESIPFSDCVQQQVKVDPRLQADPESFSPKVLVSKNLLDDIRTKLKKIEEVLLNNRSATSQLLLEGVSPILGKHYHELRLKFPNPEEALEALWGETKDGVNYCCVSSFMNDEELDNLTKKEAVLQNETQDCEPEEFFLKEKEELICQDAPLDKLIRRHSERKIKNLLDLEEVLKEFQFLKQEGLTDSKSFRDIVDFCSDLCQVPQEQDIVQEIISLLFSFPQVELQWLLTLEKYFLRIENSSSESLTLFVHGAFLKQRIFNLTESEKEFLFDSQGNIKKNTSLTGRSNVTYFPEINPEFYLKQYPEWPGYEFASTLFMRLLGVIHLPYQELILNKNLEYPVLLTQKVDGNPVFKIWQKPQAFSNLDPFHTGLLIISAILLNPEDGKEDNFILSLDGRYLIPIDNDHCFLPSTFQEKRDIWNLFTVNTTLQTKTLLFCLDEMNKPIPLKVKEHIISINFDSLLTSWMEELVKVEDRYNNLVDQDQRNVFLENGTVLRIPFYEQFIDNLHWKVNKIQDLLKSTTEQTPFSLLRAVEPFAARCYQKSFQHEDTLQKRFKAATSELYVETKTSMHTSRMSILNTRSMMNIINISEKDLQNNVTYNKMGPPDALELLNKLIQERSQNKILEQDLLCELNHKSEESIWTALFGDPVLEKAFKNFFASPKEGLVLKGSRLITESSLKDLFAQTLDQGTKIKFLSLPNSPLLDSKTIKTLVEGCPNLEYLNISGCMRLEEIATSKEEWPLLARLEAKDCLNLRKLTSSSPMKILRVGTHQKIEIFLEKSTLDNFTISTQTNQFDLWLEKEKYFHIKPPEKNISFDYFLQNALLHGEVFDKYFKNPKITIGTHAILSQKDLGVFITLIDLRASNIDQKAFQEIVQLRLINLKSLQLPQFRRADTRFFEDLIHGDWPKLTRLNLSDNEIRDEGLAILSQGNWPLLQVLNLKETEIKKKGFVSFALNTKCHNLTEITLSLIWRPRTDFPNILLQKNWHLLEKLDLSLGHITQNEIEAIVNKSKWSHLKSLNLSQNEINDEGLAILPRGNWPLLETLNLENVKITSVGIKAIVNKSQWPNLKHLNLSFNEIYDEGFAILPQGNWSRLEKLNMNNTKVTNKGLLIFYSGVKWPNLKELNLPSYIDFNLASSVHQKRFSQVERLELNNLKIAKFEIEVIIKTFQFQRLKYLNLSENQLFDEGVSFLVQANWPLLEELNIQNTNITSKGNKTISNQSNWGQLKYLDISENQFSDEGISFLTMANWPSLEKLNLQNTNITSKGIETIAKWGQLKHLNISNNEIFDEGISIFAQMEWLFLEELCIKNTKMTLQGMKILANKMKFDSLKKLDISENIIGDEGLETLASANWPSFQHLVYYNTQVTLEGNIALLENMQWPNLCHLEHSLSESFYNYNEDSDNWSLPPMILATVPVNDREKPFSVTVLDTTWLNSKEIYLSLSHNGLYERVRLLPRDKLGQVEHFKLSIYLSLIQHILLPPNLKILDISNFSLSDEKKLEKLLITKCPLLEDLNLERTNITTKGLEILKKFDWPFLQKLYISNNTISDEGLKLLFSGNWPLLESLNLSKTWLTAERIQSLTATSQWSNLKVLDISGNSLSDTGLKILSYGKWIALENLNLTLNEAGVFFQFFIFKTQSLKLVF